MKKLALLLMLLFASPLFATRGGPSNGSAIDFGSASNLDNLETVTFAGWLGFDSFNPNVNVFDKTDNGPTFYGIHFIAFNSTLWPNKFGCYIDYTVVQPGSQTGDNPTATNELHHWAWTHDVSGDRKIRIYIDGAEIGSYPVQNAGVGTRRDDSASSLVMWNPHSAQWSGYAHDVRIWSGVVLTADEIKNVMHGALVHQDKVVLTAWMVTSGTNQEPDQSGQHNNGSVTGSGWSLIAPPPGWGLDFAGGR